MSNIIDSPNLSKDQVKFKFGPATLNNVILGFVMQFDAKLPDHIVNLLRDTLGKPTRLNHGIAIWKLEQTTSLQDDDDWMWFINAVEWNSQYIHNVKFVFDKIPFENMGQFVLDLTETDGDGDLLNFYGKPEIRKLIQQYKDSKPKIITPPEIKAGHQRLTYQYWNLSKPHPDLKIVHHHILACLMSHCWSNGPHGDWCQISESLIAQQCWTSVRNLQRALPVMVQHGLISIKVIPNKASIYTIIDKSILPPYKSKGHK